MEQIDYSRCPTGRQMEINMAKLTTDVEYIKNSQLDMKSDIKNILKKLENQESEYAKKEEVNEIKAKINWANSAAISALITVVLFLIKQTFFS